MSKKKNKKRNAGPPKPMVQLSQCMIVKNEEKNIERALGWAKRVAYEQIVVDTGSTDRTVEIARKMGAKVHHFEWINDFSAAKNYAIEQATGNWIAFLDADEYFTPEDATKIMAAIRKVQTDPMLREQYQAINCPMVHLNDEGKPFSINEHTRIFRKSKAIRYIGKIHEKLNVASENIVLADDVSIFHTGYTAASYTETDKAERNVAALRVELAERPDDMDIKIYLADSLRGKAREDGPEAGKASEDEAAALYAEAAAWDGAVDRTLHKKAHMYTIATSISSDADLSECEEMCLRARKKFPDVIDFVHYHAQVLNKRGDFRAAWDLLRICEARLESAPIKSESNLIEMKPGLLFNEMITSAQGLGDVVSVVRYASMSLMDNKAQQGILGPFIATLLENGTSEDEVASLLVKIYDFSDAKDVLIVARAAKDCGAIDFARKIAELAGKLV